jgi:outer membrane protein TolC
MLEAHAKKLMVIAMVLSCALVAPVRGQNAHKTQPGNVTIDLKNALELARNNSPQLQSAALGIDLARRERSLAKMAFYPTLDYYNQYLYTQGNGTSSGVWVPNDGVHVYASHATVHQELFSPGRMAEYRRSLAGEALAVAKRDVAIRGIVATVFQDYYGLVTSQRHFANAQQSLEEARHFVEVTEKLERGGEVAHADVVKARLTLQQRERENQETQLAVEKAKVSLAVLMFPDYRTDFAVVNDLASVAPLPSLDQLQAQARETNPDLRAAQQMLRQEEFGVSIARSAFLPSLSFDYFYGINANRFATRDEEGRSLLGSVAQATLNIPIFNWWATSNKVRQADLKRRQAQLDLTLAQRELDLNLRTSYMEAQSALGQLDSLKQSLDLSVESLRLTSLRYEAGEATVLEVVDAQSTLAQARNAYDDGLARYRLAFANLQTLTGNY